MAEHTKTHLWINTVMAGLAFAASAGSLIFARNTYQLKTESIGLVARGNVDCSLQYRKVMDFGAVGLCWSVTITNQSELRTSIIDHKFSIKLRSADSYFSGFTEVEDTNGNPATFPIILDGGEARSFTIRIPVKLSPSIATLAAELKQNGKQKLTLFDLQTAAYSIGTDLIGNPVDAKKIDTFWAITYDKMEIVAEAQIRFDTGRGNTFSIKSSYPPLD